MHDLLGVTGWLLYGAGVVILAAPYVLVIGTVVGIYYTYRVLKKRKMQERMGNER